MRIFLEITISTGEVKTSDEEQYNRMFQGETVEELLYKFDQFLKL